MFCPGHPPGWSAVPACPFGCNPSTSLLVFFLAPSYQQLLSLHCFLPFSACVHTSVVSYLWLSLVCYSLLAPFWCPVFTLSRGVTPLILLNILMSVFLRICTSFFPTVQHSAPYRSTGLMTVMWLVHTFFINIHYTDYHYFKFEKVLLVDIVWLTIWLVLLKLKMTTSAVECRVDFQTVWLSSLVCGFKGWLVQECIDMSFVTCIFASFVI